MRVVSVGECMVELAPAEGDLLRPSFAGDTFNTAWYLARLRPGWTVDYATRVGTDGLSDRMVAAMADAGIGTAHVVRDPMRTVGLYLIELQDGERSFSYWRGQSAARRLAEGDALADAFAGADLIYLSGITLGILDAPGRAALMDRLDAARAAGARVAFDPNLRPRLWPDGAAMCSAVMTAAARADIVLPSHEDEATWFGDADPQATLDRYKGAGAAVVAVKDGPGRVICAVPDGLAHHDPAPVQDVVDSTAAGDSWNAGFLAAWLDGAKADTALRAGCDLSAKVIGGRGALVPV
ncbi:sugar kinase [uncultured Jannaschia sp.]|uniref:sugar kinase n=1 Tax=uncultured Jannaschia sp. TaxID=293347 RepID=UPI0026338BA6|nr:sugar kinase [uncultured Jannaschia sp.]